MSEPTPHPLPEYSVLVSMGEFVRRNPHLFTELLDSLERFAEEHPEEFHEIVDLAVNDAIVAKIEENEGFSS